MNLAIICYLLKRFCKKRTFGDKYFFLNYFVAFGVCVTKLIEIIFSSSSLETFNTSCGKTECIEDFLRGGEGVLREKILEKKKLLDC